jgi:hypothetical protein
MTREISAEAFDALVAEVQLLKDKTEIRETLDRYWFGEDRCDPDAVASAFTEDARYGTLESKDEIRSRMQWGLPLYDSMQHCFASSKVEIDGDRATADTMAIGFNVGPNDDGEQRVLVRGLRYVDELVRTDDGWAIARRGGHDEPDHGHDTFWQFEGVTTDVWHPQGGARR